MTQRLERTRRWRIENPEKVAAYNAARREAYREQHAAEQQRTCTECGTEFEGRSDRLVCSRKCKDRRYKRLHPVEWKAKRARYDRRRQERKRRATSPERRDEEEAP